MNAVESLSYLALGFALATALLLVLKRKRPRIARTAYVFNLIGLTAVTYLLLLKEPAPSFLVPVAFLLVFENTLIAYPYIAKET